MAVLSDIREKSPKFIIAGAAVVFIFLIIFDWGFDISGRKGGDRQSDVIGVVNGKEVNYRMFNELVRRTVENQKQQQKNIEIDAETERQIRSQVWNQIVDEILFEQEMDRLGIKVTDQEIRDILTGPNPPQFLVQQFTDSTGTFRRDVYQTAILDPQNKDILIQVEESIRQEQKRIKLQSLLLATTIVSENEIKERFIDRNTILDAKYVLFDINRLVPDSEVNVTDSDLKKQYEEHAADFQSKAARKIKYVRFNQTASAEDTAAIERDLQSYMEQVNSGIMDFTEVVKTYSEIPMTDAYFKHGELSRQKEDAIFSAKKGDIVGPIKDNDGIHMIRILDQRQGKDEFIKCSHILLNVVQGPDSVKVIQKARTLLAEARAGADFSKLARENSNDYASAIRGGDLGWASRDRYVKPFADAAFRTQVGGITGPVRTQFGWHIIKVTGRDKREIKIADLALKINASNETIETAYQNAEDFSILAEDEGFEKAAENSKYLVAETPEFQKTGSIPGIGMNDAVASFSFENKLGDISDPLYVRDGIIVAMISNIREEGVRPLEEVKNQVKALAVNQKKMEKIRERADEFYKAASGGIEAAANSFNVNVQNTGEFRLSDGPPGLGRDMKFIGGVVSLNPGEVSKPVESSRGYYVIQLLSKSAFDSVKYNMERDGLGEQILQEKRNRVVGEWHTALREKADIEDNRGKFFR
ncbi:MAG: peptidylprolyl isomerase [Bacteroidetes bacterium]|nr:peptidylprolyl isomerase [Bacteroidota bacterium]